MPARCILRVTQRALPTAVSGGTDVAALLVTRSLGRSRRGRRLGHPGGRRATRGLHGPAPGPSGARHVVSGTHDAARLAPIARMSWMLVGHASATIRDRSVACLCRDGELPQVPVANGRHGCLPSSSSSRDRQELVSRGRIRQVPPLARPRSLAAVAPSPPSPSALLRLVPDAGESSRPELLDAGRIRRPGDPRPAGPPSAVSKSCRGRHPAAVPLTISDAVPLLPLHQRRVVLALTAKSHAAPPAPSSPASCIASPSSPPSPKALGFAASPSPCRRPCFPCFERDGTTRPCSSR
nr:uncharacterized protein LOC120973981 [Aegilops tauschii subsp. strangulata]